MRLNAIKAMFKLGMFLFCSAMIAPASFSQTAKFLIPESNSEWYVENADRTGDVRFADFAGRRSIWLRNNTQLIRNNVEFTDGTIEFEMAPMEAGNFVALIFRRESGTSHENIYFRIHRSGLYNALQYAPRINGSSTWQLYPEFNSTILLPRKQWTKARVEVTGTRLEIFVNGEPKPALSVARLRGVARSGKVGFWARVNNKPAEWAAGLSNISIRPRTGAGSTEPAKETAGSGAILDWEASEAFAASDATKLDPRSIQEWKKAAAEENGLVNLNRLFPAVRGRRTTFVRTSVNSAEARIARLDLGYSDEVRVILNGEEIYQGVNGFESRHPEYMGFVKPEFENVYMRLKPGKNELILAVADDQRFGWGFIARLSGDQ